MIEIFAIPIALTHFQLPKAVQARLQLLFDRQDNGNMLSHTAQPEAAELVELTEFLSLLHLRSTRALI
ncbi:MAG: hypothetical protein AAFY20_08105 [Cyanobacteria bacterium J06639_14]